MTDDTPYLFVYGTLRKGGGADLSRLCSATCVGAGRGQGLLFMLDRYPGMVESSNQSDFVIGETYRLNEPAHAWPILDRYEGCGETDPHPHEYQRKITTITMDDGATLRACAYFYCLSVTGRTRILSGDYLQRRD
jgi:gamma-glutamylcyclotransferase (GGCT)/AIG2-like uncharacterized protein YtfP